MNHRAMNGDAASRRGTVFWLTAFGVAMGFLEAIVVVYLRALYYPRGFDFPMAAMPRPIYVAELVRELCTIVMLLSVAFLVGRSRLQRFAVFLFSFVVWDVAYYVGLKVFLDWPDSLHTWDVLFLIPVPWFGPVLSPLLYCTAMLAVAWAAVRLDDAGRSLTRGVLLLLGLSTALALAAFMADAYGIVAGAARALPDPALREARIAQDFLAWVPRAFRWDIFLPGLAAGYAAAWRMARQARASA